MSNIKIPIAVKNKTFELVDAKSVPNGLACDCYCPKCKGELIAVNQEKKQKAHFRHQNSNCIFSKNYESYIHWLAKEIYKNVKSISLPSIKISDLQRRYAIGLREEILSQLKDHQNGVTHDSFTELEQFIKIQPNEIILQKASVIKITNSTCEKEYKSKSGNIRVDIVIMNNKNELFIEPYYLNKIDDIKLEKLKEINTSTISVNLLDFVRDHDFLFTLDEITTFLINDISSKRWVYIRKSKVDQLKKKFFNNPWPTIVQEIKDQAIKNTRLEEKIAENNKKVMMLEKENSNLRSIITEIDVNEIIKNKHWL